MILSLMIILTVWSRIKALQSACTVPQVRKPEKKVSKAIKLIFLWSGSSLLCSAPAVIAWLPINMIYPIGNREESFVLVTSIRLLACLATAGSSALNSPIQFLVQKDLFVGVLKLMGKTAYFSWQKEVLEMMNTKN